MSGSVLNILSAKFNPDDEGFSMINILLLSAGGVLVVIVMIGVLLQVCIGSVVLGI